MRIPKKYGTGKKQDCPFCGEFSTATNSQEVPVCRKHVNNRIENFKCLCGDWLDLVSGKFGPYFRCVRCGNMNFQRGIEVNKQCLYQKNPLTNHPPSVKEPQATTGSTKKEIVIRSDELDFWT